MCWLCAQVVFKAVGASAWVQLSKKQISVKNFSNFWNFKCLNNVTFLKKLNFFLFQPKVYLFNSKTLKYQASKIKNAILCIFSRLNRFFSMLAFKPLPQFFCRENPRKIYEELSTRVQPIPWILFFESSMCQSREITIQSCSGQTDPVCTPWYVQIVCTPRVKLTSD